MVISRREQSAPSCCVNRRRVWLVMFGGSNSEQWIRWNRRLHSAILCLLVAVLMHGCTSGNGHPGGDACVECDGIDEPSDADDGHDPGDQQDAGEDGHDGIGDDNQDGDDGDGLWDGDGGGEDGADPGPDADCSMPHAITCDEVPSECCGDGVCSGEERCWDCQEDCGPCYELVWSASFPEAVSAPALTADGHVVVNGEQRTFCVSSVGTQLWDVPIDPYGPAGSPSVEASDQNIVIVGRDGTVNWLDPNGDLVEQKRFEPDHGHPTNSHASPALEGARAAIAFVSVDQATLQSKGKVALLHHGPGEDWVRDMGDYVVPTSHPAIDSSGNIFVLNGVRKIQLLKYTSSGDLDWSYVVRNIDPPDPLPEDWGAFDPVIGLGDCVLVALRNGTLVSVSSGGELRWEKDLGSLLEAEPAVGPDGTAFVGRAEGYLTAVSHDGGIMWSSPVGVCQDVWPYPVSVAASPLVVKDGLLMVGGSGYLDAVRAGDGARMYRIELPEILGLTDSPVMTENGLMFVVEFERLYAIQTVHSGPETGIWSRARGDCQNSSRAGLGL